MEGWMAHCLRATFDPFLADGGRVGWEKTLSKHALR